MVILISGATGFIGQSIIPSLISAGHIIFAVVRNVDSRLPQEIEQVTIDDLQSTPPPIDVFINLAGENIAARPWSASRKKALYDSRVTLTNEIKKRLRYSPKTVVSMSAIGFYGASSAGVFEEDSPPNKGFTHELCKAWENAAKAFSSNECRVVIFRLGVVLGNGGALEKMRLPFLLGLGGPIAGGHQWFSWVHVNDVVNAINDSLVKKDYSGVYNLVSPERLQQKDFAKSYAARLNRPSLLPTPKLLLTTMFGEMACLLTEGAQIIPKRLIEQGFEFEYEDINKALEAI